MNDSLTVPFVRFRDFCYADIPAWVDIDNRTWPDHPTTIESREYREKTFPRDVPQRRIVLESAGGKFIGIGGCFPPFWMIAPGVYFVWILIDPDWRRRGLGQTLALKVLSLRQMKECGCTQALTNNDTANPSILYLNERLGYQKRPGDLQWEKCL